MRVRIGSPLSRITGIIMLAGLATGCGADPAAVSETPSQPTQPDVDEEGAWTSRSGLPQPLSGSAAAVWRGSIFVLGGYADDRNGDPTHHVVRIDPVSLEVERLSDFPEAVSEAALVVYHDTLLAIGGIRGVGSGRTVSNAMRWYDPEEDSWKGWSLLPEPRGGHAAEVVEDRLYVIGGGTADGPRGDSIIGFEGREPARLAPPNREVTPPLVGSVVGDTIFVLSSSFDSRLLRLDGRKGVWLPPIGLSTSGRATGGALRGRVHTFHVGYRDQHRIWSDRDLRWLSASPPNTPVESAAVVSVGDRLFLIGGLTTDQSSINRIQVYTPG